MCSQCRKPFTIKESAEYSNIGINKIDRMRILQTALLFLSSVGKTRQVRTHQKFTIF
ncbi:MAG: hypothetical protein IJ302_09860 [Clostridia bacterium]|nr:hypothetical protein [Clostridia bacterium]